jgi:HAMP domain-containing protein
LKFRLRMSITTKLLASFLALSFVLLAVLGFFTIFRMNDVGNIAEESSVTLGSSAMTDGTRILEVIGESNIRQKDLDVAGQLRIYFNNHPVYDRERLMSYTDLVEVALQTIGDTGYTAVFEKGTGIMRIHPNAAFINYDMHQLQDKLPDFWKIYSRALDGSISSGYYLWEDPDGRMREKFMYMAPVEGTPFMAAATAYVDEISKPMVSMENRVSVETEETIDRIGETISQARVYFIIFFGLALVVVALLVFWLSRKITAPIKVLSQGSQAIGNGDLDYKVDVHSGDELEGLANSFNQMSSDLKKFTVELRRTTAEKERVEKELEIARGIQQSFLPENPPAIEGMELAALNLSAKEVGGDFYDFIPVGTKKWGLVIADVSGKGVPAALFMALSRTLVRANVSDNLSAAATIIKSNELISENDRSNMFVTLFYGVLDPVKRSLTYVSAGHNPPFVIRRGGQDIITLKARGVALGVMPDIELEEKEIILDSGDVVVLYTDGVTEAVNNHDELIGEQRVMKLAEQSRELSAAEIVQRIKNGVLEFSQEQPQFDDITLMVLKVK